MWRIFLGGILMVSRQLLLAALLVAAVGSANPCQAQLCAQLSGFNFTENFNSLAASGSSTSLPSEFAFVESGTAGNLTYSADNGAASTGNTYSYGSTGSSDRALGELTSGTVQSTVGACFVNNTNHAFTSLILSYTGEQWRAGDADGFTDILNFQFGQDATALNSGTYVDVNSLDFSTPNTTSAAGLLNGNSAANRTVIGPVVIPLATPLQPEKTFYIRWSPLNTSAPNDGLAIDDFSLGVTMAPGFATDYNNNNVVDAGDYVIWRKRLNQAVTIPNDITPGTVVQQDYVEWVNRFGKTAGEIGSGTSGAIPEPSAAILLALATVFVFVSQRARDLF
jgi:hypothetical protein